MAIAGAALCLLSVAACGTDPEPAAAPAPRPGDSTATAPETAAPETAAPATSKPAAVGLYDAACAGTLEVTTVGQVAAGAGAELSGIVASRSNPGVYWVHNDSGAGPEVYAIADDGSLLASYELDADAFDWEDIAIGPGPGTDEWSLYLADIGDNNEVRTEIVLYRVAEPEVAAGGTGTVAPDVLQPIDAVDVVTLTYPDHAHNAEALFVDPETGDAVIVTKAVVGPALIFVAPAASLVDGATVTLTAAGAVDFGDGGLAAWVTGADIAPDGSVIAVRTYGGVHLFARAAGQSATDALTTTPCEGPNPVELQGEAIGIAADGGSYLTVAEGEEPLLHRTG